MEQHLVQKYTFDVGFDSESKSFHFQNQLADLVKNKLVDLSDDIFTEFSSGKEISIEKLTIDLGTIPIENLEAEICSVFKSRLKDKLSFLLSMPVGSFTEEKVEFVLKKESNFKIFEYFFTNGMLPWSAVKDNSEFSIQKLVDSCIVEDVVQVKTIVAPLIAHKEKQLRIIRQLEDETLWKILGVWKDVEVNPVKRFYSDLILVLKHKPLLNYFSESRELLWKFIFDHTILKGNTKYNDKVWINQFIEFTVRETNTPLDQIVKLLNTSINEIDGSEKKTLFKTQIPQVTLDLMKRNPEFLDENKNSEKNKLNQEFEKFRQQQINIKLDYLINYLKISHYNFNPEELKAEREKSESIIKEFYQLNPAALKKAFMDSYFNIKSFYSQQVLELFSKQVKEILLKEIFVVGINQFEVIKNETIKRALMVLIDTGNFPYSVLPVPIKNTVLNTLIQDLYTSDKEEVKRIVKKAMSLRTEKDQKLIHVKNILSPKTIKLLFADQAEVILSARISDSDLSGVLNKLTDFKSQENFINVIQFLFKEKSLPGKPEYSVAQLIEKFLALHKDTAQAYFSSVSEKDLKVIQKSTSPDLIKKITERRLELNKAFRELKSDKNEESPTQKANQKSPDADVPSKRVQSDIENNQPGKPKSLENKVESKDPAYEFKERNTEEPIYINNAGMIIFHPYLNRFFNMLNLLDKKSFKDEYSAHKAVYILQYLVNKGLNNEEHELVLNKLLCGIDINTPLIRDIEITEEDKNTCESLIEGVIQNWPILKKTSNDNFRGSFLIREGRLTLNPHIWKLKVEERGYDILVEKIPWSLSMIKLSWMDKMLNVEWK